MFNKAKALAYYTNRAKEHTEDSMHTLAIHDIASYLREKENQNNKMVNDISCALLSLEFLHTEIYGCANEISKIREDLYNKLITYLKPDELEAFNNVM